MALAYDSKRRFISYWHQIHEVVALKPRNILEVGVGTGFVVDYLKKQGMTVTTVDIDERRKPDYVATITSLPFEERAFDVATAFEVLEHMPYEESLRGLQELYRVSARWVIISLPDATRYFRFEIPLPKIGKWRWLYTVPIRHPEGHAMGDEGHYWEIGKKNYPLTRIAEDIKKTGLDIKKTYRVFENPYHRFFILQKV